MSREHAQQTDIMLEMRDARNMPRPAIALLAGLRPITHWTMEQTKTNANEMASTMMDAML